MLESRHRPVDSHHLAAPAHVIAQLHASLGEAFHDLGGPVVGAIHGHQDLHTVMGIIECQRVLELGGDDILLIVGGDQDRDLRGDIFIRLFPAPQPRQERHDQRIAHIDISDEQDAEPEEQSEQFHAVCFSCREASTSRYRSR